MAFSLGNVSNTHAAHRKALVAAIARVNAGTPPAKNIRVIVSTKNMVKNLPRALLGMKSVVQLTGFGRLYTDYGIFGRMAFHFCIGLYGLTSARAFIVENESDRAIISRITARPVFAVHGSGLDAQGFTRKPKKRGKILRLGYLSRFHKSKGTRHLLDAVKNLPEDREIHIAGWDITGDAYAGTFAAIADAKPNVHFTGRLASRAEVSRFFAQVDILLAPSAREGLNVAVQEAIWHRVPFLTTTSPGCKVLADIFGCPAIEMKDFAAAVVAPELAELSPDTRNWDKLLAPFMADAVEEEFVKILEKVKA